MTFCMSFTDHLARITWTADGSVWLFRPEANVLRSDGTVLTPVLNGSILEGVTRSSVIPPIKDQDPKVVERDITLAVRPRLTGIQYSRADDAFGWMNGSPRLAS